jgi:hypothetical protein
MKRKQRCSLLAVGFLLTVCAGGQAPAQPAKEKSVDDVGPGKVELKGSYLGVKVRQVPESLAKHLGLGQGKGVMVEAVIDESPAQKAGIESSDIILQADGKEVESGEDLIGVIHVKEPGSSVELKLIHRGLRIEKAIAVSARPEHLDSVSRKQVQEVPVLRSQDLKLLRGQVKVRPDGKIQISLGEQGEIQLPDEIQKLLNRNLQDASGVIGGMGFVSKGHDGGVLTVKKRPDGTFQVIRAHTDKASSTKVYKDLETLKKQDADAFRLYTYWQKKGISRPKEALSGSGAVEKLEKPAQREKALESLRKLVKKIEEFEQMDEAPGLPDIKELYRLHRFAGEGEDEAGAKSLPSPEEALADWTKTRNKARAGQAAPVTRRKFDVQADGKVTVQIEKDGNELTQTFESLEVMRRKAPDLHEHYEKLLTAD